MHNDLRMPVIILYYATADCGGQFNDVTLQGIIDYLNPGDRNITFRDCPPAMTPTDHEGAMTYVSTGMHTLQGNDQELVWTICMLAIYDCVLF